MSYAPPIFGDQRAPPPPVHAHSHRARPASAAARPAAPLPTHHFAAAAAAAAPAASSGSNITRPRTSTSSSSVSQHQRRIHSTTDAAESVPSRIQQLFGKASAAAAESGHPAYSSTRLAYIPLELLRVTAEEKSALNALQPGKKSYWSTGSGQNHELVFKITAACLVGFVKLLNRSTSHLEILVSMHDVPNQYVCVQSDLHCPHNKTVMYPMGFLPARFVKIKCRRGTPISLYNVSVVGVLERVVWREMGPDMGNMIVEHPEALLLPSKPALPASLAGPAFPSQQTIKEQEPQPRIQFVTR